METVRNIIKNNEDIIILLAFSLVLSIASAIYFIGNDYSVANGDVIARLNMSRRVIDNLNPGFSQLGYVWLPINNLLMLPLIGIDFFYYSGLAGTVISMLSFIFSSILIYKIGSFLHSSLAGFIAFLIFVTNPNILYMQATPLTEIFFIFILLAGLYFTLKWSEKRSVRYLFASSFFLMLGTLSRYDAWIIVGFFALVIGVHELIKSRSLKKTEAVLILFGVIGFFGPIVWLFWNFVLFGNPLYFAFGKYSAKNQQVLMEESNMLPSYHDLINSIMHVFVSGKLVMGTVLVILGILGLIYISRKSFTKKRWGYLFLLILFLQPLYYVINLFMGNGVIFVPDLEPNIMHNIRYAVTFIPFFALASGVFIARYKIFAFIIVGLIMLEYCLLFVNGNIITLNESLAGMAGKSHSEIQIEAAHWLNKNYNGGLILSDVFVNDPVAFHSKIKLKNWISSGNSEKYKRALLDPYEHADWILMNHSASGDEIVVTLEDNLDLETKFELVYKEKSLEIYKKKEDLYFEISPEDQTMKTILEIIQTHHLREDGMVESEKEKTTSESQSYVMLMAVMNDNKELFDKTWRWTKENLQHKEDNLFSWLWLDGRVKDTGSATDADQDIAYALYLAHNNWGGELYLKEAREIIEDIWRLETKELSGNRYVGAGNWTLKERNELIINSSYFNPYQYKTSLEIDNRFRKTIKDIWMLETKELAKGRYPGADNWLLEESEGLIINPSYFDPSQYKVFAEIDPDRDWNSIVDSSYKALNKCTGSVGLAQDWCKLNSKGNLVRGFKLNEKDTTIYSYDAIRIPYRIARDYIMNKDQRALDYLNKNQIFFKDWRENNIIFAVYNQQGHPVNQNESFAHYGIQLASMSLLNEGISREIFEKKIKAIEKWDNISFYDMSWLWFGLNFSSKIINK